MKIIIIGSGKVGSKISQQLALEGHDVVVIDNDAVKINEMSNNQDVMCIEGNAVSFDVQQQAGVNDADLVIACTDSDEINMISCLLAKKHGAARTIARVRNPEYYDQLPFIKEEMGLSMALNPEMMAADMISRVLLFPAANSVESFAGGNVELMEFVLSASNPLVGMSLMDVNSTFKVKVLIVAIQRGDQVIIPTGNDVLQAEDHIYVASSHAEIQTLVKDIDLFRSKIRSVIIVGGSRITYYLAKRLLGHGMTVKIIENDRDKCIRMSQALPNAMIVNADGSDENVLIEEGIGNTDAFVAMTGMDEVNIILSIYAKKKGVPKVITKVTQLTFYRTLENLGLDTIVSPKTLTADQILRYVRAMNESSDSDTVESLLRFVDERLEAAEFIINNSAKYVEIPLKDLKIKKGFLVASIVRGKCTIIPGGNDVLKLGDTVVIVTDKHPLLELSSIFE